MYLQLAYKLFANRLDHLLMAWAYTMLFAKSLYLPMARNIYIIRSSTTMTNGTEYGGHGPLLKLISQYPILTTLASQIPTLDLLNLGLTSMIYYDYILASSSGWTKLKSICLCDGQGLRDRQDLKGLYRLTSWQYIWGHSRKIHEDEEIEVKLYNLRCRDDDTLPCCKCGINVCEECRYYPRAPPRYPYAVRRPHLTAARELQNIMLLCESCDEKVEKEVNGKFLNHLCDCDVFTRWICIKCRIDERNEAHDYFVMFTKTDDQLEREYEAEDGLEQAETKWVGDHQCSRYVSFLLGILSYTLIIA